MIIFFSGTVEDYKEGRSKDLHMLIWPLGVSETCQTFGLQVSFFQTDLGQSGLPSALSEEVKLLM